MCGINTGDWYKASCLPLRSLKERDFCLSEKQTRSRTRERSRLIALPSVILRFRVEQRRWLDHRTRLFTSVLTKLRRRLFSAHWNFMNHPGHSCLFPGLSIKDESLAGKRKNLGVCLSHSGDLTPAC